MEKYNIKQELERRLRESEIKNISGFVKLLIEASFEWGFDYGYEKGRKQASKELALLLTEEQFEV